MKKFRYNFLLIHVSLSISQNCYNNILQVSKYFLLIHVSLSIKTAAIRYCNKLIMTIMGKQWMKTKSKNNLKIKDFQKKYHNFQTLEKQCLI